jgi:N-acetylmuramic acid 6-phosphate etherase
MMPVRSKWERLPTEAVNPRTRGIDQLRSGAVIKLMVRDNRRAFRAVEREIASIAKGVALITRTLQEDGRVIFAGAGTSGRLGVLEAAEMPPTFGTRPEAIQALMAGGPGAVYRAKEGAEDQYHEGQREMRRLRPTSNDTVVGVSASGITPFVQGAAEYAKSKRARVIAVSCDRRSDLRKLADVSIILNVGPEVIAGSSRLKAGTATKMVLNLLTTASMIRIGKTYGNLMVDVGANSDKLRDRARRIVMAVTGAAMAEADAILTRADWNVKAAILMHSRGLSLSTALSALRREPRLGKLLGRGRVQHGAGVSVQLKKRRRAQR